MSNQNCYEVTSILSPRAHVIIFHGENGKSYEGVVPSFVVSEFGLGFRTMVNRETVDELFRLTDEAFENYDDRLGCLVGNSDERAVQAVSIINDRGGWKVLCDRNGYPLSALLLSDYEDFCNYFGDCKYLDEKVAWFSKPLPKGIPSV